MVDKLTFGCGEFLPGQGPFGFPDYVPSPGVDGNGGGGGEPPERGDECQENDECPECFECNSDNECIPIDPCITDPCDGVSCPDPCEICIDGACACPPGQPCAVETSNCFQVVLDCDCYPASIVKTEQFVTNVRENSYILETQFTFNQACYSEIVAEVEDPTSAQYISKINSINFVSVSPQPGGVCPGGCPGQPGKPEGANLNCQDVIVVWRELITVPGGVDPDLISPGGATPGELGGDLGEGVTNPGGIANATTPQNNNSGLLNQATNLVKNAFNFISEFSNVKKPSEYALEDYEITVPKGAPEKNFTQNTVGYRSILKDRIHKSINTILSTGDSFDDWESKTLAKLNTKYIIGSIQDDLYTNFKSITKTDGSEYSDKEISDILKSKIIDGTLQDLDINHIKNLIDLTVIYKKQQITPSKNSYVNENAALALIEQTMIPMTPTSPGITTKIMDNWKTFATDLNKYVEIEIAGVKQKYYINDDDTVVDFPEYKISDGDVLKVSIGGRRYNLPVKSEKSRAYVVPEPARQQALTLLRGNPARTLYVDVDTSANVDFNYSLNIDDDADRQNAYFFKLIPSSTTKTNDNPSTDIITTTEGKYELMDSTTEAGIAEINEYIKYKYNHRSVFLPHDDIIFDYIESASSINMIQQDVLPPQSKDNPDLPLLVRDYPWYLIVVPTNRSDYLESTSKSRIVSYNVDGKNRRQVTTKPLIDPKFVTQKSPLFTKTNLSITNTNVYGNTDVQGRQTEFSLDQDIYKTVYRDSNGTYGRPSEVRLRRKKNGFRIIKEILDELNTNYILGSNPKEKTIYKNDLMSRMSMREYNLFFGSENSSYLFPLIEKGLFNDIKIVPTSRRKESALRLSPTFKTKLIKRRGAASTIDKFPIIKSTNSGRYLENPDQDTLYSARFRDRDQSDINSRGESSRNS